MRVRARSLAGLAVLIVVVSAAVRWVGGADEARLGPALAAQARAGDIRMVSSLTCPYCTAARQWLTLHRVTFDECWIERDEACRATFEALPVRGTPTMIVRGHVQTGFEPARVLQALERAPAGPAPGG